MKNLIIGLILFSVNLLSLKIYAQEHFKSSLTAEELNAAPIKLMPFPKKSCMGKETCKI